MTAIAHGRAGGVPKSAPTLGESLGAFSLGDERAARLWTPERVPLTVPLAGLGERAFAYGIDLSIVLGTVAALFFVYNFWGDLTADYAALTPLGKLLFLVVAFGAVVAYDVLFEVFGEGRTPGKRLMRLRVLRAEGRCPDATSALIRNVLRLVDYLPFFYGLGTVVLFLTGTRRLGDLLANTFVVTERARSQDPFVACARIAGEAGPLTPCPAWSDEALLLALELVGRLRELPPEVAARLARRLLLKIDPPLVEAHPDVPPPALLARACLALRERRGGLGAQIARAGKANQNLAAALLAVRAAPSRKTVERLDDAIRHAASELMRATRRGVPAPVLEALSLSLLDAERRRSASRRRGGLARLFTVEVPAAVYRERRQIARAAAVLLGAVVIGAGLAFANPALGKALVGEELAHAIEQGAFWTDRIEATGRFAQAAVTIVLNNTWVAIVAFLSGLLGGAGPLLVLFGNGLYLGAIFGYAIRLGTAGTLGKFVLAHGPTELCALCVAGAAGLCLGRALLAPGRRTRLDALREESATGAKLLVAALAALVVIGGVEGFLSPGSFLPWPVSLLLGLGMLGLFASWVIVLGKPQAERRAPGARRSALGAVS